MDDAEDEVEFYSQERWDNWVARLQEADLEDEEESSQLYVNLQNDAAIAVAKVLRAHEEDRLSDEEALDELETIQEIVLAEVELQDEDANMLIDAVQTSLVSAFMASEHYVIDGVAEADDIESLVAAAAEAETEENFDEALEYLASAGTLIIDGHDLDVTQTEEFEYGLVTEWVGGLDSLQEALAGPKVVEEE